MAMSTLYFTAPAVTAALGFYFFDRYHSNSKGVGKGKGAMVVAKVKEELKSSGMPKMTPQFDGLHYFETLVQH